MQPKPPPYETWTSEDYKVIQLILDVPSKYKAVWALPDIENDAHGPHHLEAHEIEALGVAEVTATTYRRPKGSLQLATVEDIMKYSRIVVLELRDGNWEVANESSNFSGIMKDGQEVGDCIHDLHSIYRALLPKKEGK